MLVHNLQLDHATDQMLVQNLQLLYHNHQQQVDMENYMNYMLLNPFENEFGA